MNSQSETQESLNKMHVMEDVVTEGCDTQPSSPGHADQRTADIVDSSSFTDDDKKELNNKSEDDAVCQTDESPQKRRLHHTSSDDQPVKKSKTIELQQELLLRNKILNEFTEVLDMSNFDKIHAHTEQLITDIHKLNEIAKEKEREWNNILHTKKLKEELLGRIQRQRQIYMMSNGLDISDLDSQDDRELVNGERTNINNQQHIRRQQLLKQQQQQQQQQSLLIKSLQNNLDMNGIDGKSNKQRPVRDVQSIIADYRQKHPENVPRRGRRIRSSLNGQTVDAASNKGSPGGIINFSNMALGSGSQVRQFGTYDNEIGAILSAMDSANQDGSIQCSADSLENASFKDILVQFAKLSQSEKQEFFQNTIKPPPPYPEVTVHPVSTTPPSNSLLHGILTKAQNKATDKSAFSPTLARLLTTPERSAAVQSQVNNNNSKLSNVSISDILSNTNKQTRNEITITPVRNEHEVSPKRKLQTDEEEAEDSVDRLVIDEGGELIDRADNNSDNGDEVPQCQGCNQKAAQFVCAGCGNQWYCSRDCQVSAWDEHSEICSG